MWSGVALWGTGKHQAMEMGKDTELVGRQVLEVQCCCQRELQKGDESGSVLITVPREKRRLIHQQFTD